MSKITKEGLVVPNYMNDQKKECIERTSMDRCSWYQVEHYQGGEWVIRFLYLDGSGLWVPYEGAYTSWYNQKLIRNHKKVSIK